MPQSAIPPGRHAPVRPEWLAKRQEEAIEPQLPIVDPHHHMWDRPGNRYLFEDLLADVGSGHNVVATCFEECREMYRADGPQELKSLGETEFVNGIAAMSASGKYGATAASPALSAMSTCGSAAAPRVSSNSTSRSLAGALREFATALPGTTIRAYKSTARVRRKVFIAMRNSARGLPGWRRWGSALTHGCSRPSSTM